MVSAFAGISARAVGIVDADIRPFRRSLGQGLDALEHFDARSARAGQGLQQMGIIAAGVGAGISVFAANSAKAFINFEQAIANVGAVADATAPQLKQLEDLALEIGENTKFTATEAAGGMEELAKAGVETVDILDGAAAAAADLAAATGASISNAAVSMSTAMNTFELAGSQAAHVADVFAAATNKSALTMDQLNSGLSQSSQVAKIFGLSFEENVALLAAFADQGLKGSDAGTSLRTMLLSLVDPTKEQAQWIEKLGFAFTDQAGNFLEIDQIATNLVGSLHKLTQEERNTALAVIFGTDAIRASNVVYSLAGDGVDEYVNKVNDVGAAQRQAQLRMDTTAGAIEKMRGSFNTLQIQLGRGLAPTIRSTAETFDAISDAIGSVDKETLGAVGRMVALTGAILLVAGAGAKIIQFGQTTAATWRNVGTSLTGVGGQARSAAGGMTAAGAASRTSAGNVQALDAAMVALTSAANASAAALNRSRGAIVSTGVAAAVAGRQITQPLSGFALMDRRAKEVQASQRGAAAAIAVTGTNAATTSRQLGPLLTGLGSLARFAGMTIAIPILFEMGQEAHSLATEGGDPGFFDNLIYGTARKLDDALAVRGLDVLAKPLTDWVENEVDRAEAGLAQQDYVLDLGFTLNPVMAGGGPEDALINELGLTIDEVEEAASNLQLDPESFLEGVAEMVPMLRELEITYVDAAAAAQAAGKQTNIWVKEQFDAKVAADEAAKAKAGLGDAEKQAAAAAEQTTTAYDAQGNVVDAATGEILEHKKSVQQLAEEEAAAKKEADDLKRAVQEIANAEFLAAQASEGVFNPFIEGAEDAERAANDFNEEVDKFIAGSLKELGATEGLFDLSDPLAFLNDNLELTADNVVDLGVSFDAIGIIPLDGSTEAAFRFTQALLDVEKNIAAVNSEIEASSAKISEHQGVISLVDRTLGTAEDGYANLNAAIGVNGFTLDEANKAYADAMYLRDQAVIGIENEEVAILRNFSVLADYVRAHEGAAASVGLLSKEQRGLAAALQTAEVQQFLLTLQTLAYLEAIDAIPEEKVVEFITNAASQSDLIAGVVDDLGILDQYEATATATVEVSGREDVEVTKDSLDSMRENPAIVRLGLDSSQVDRGLAEVHEALTGGGLPTDPDGVVRIHLATSGEGEVIDAIELIAGEIDENLITPQFITYLDANGSGAIDEAELVGIALHGFERTYSAFLEVKDEVSPVVAGATDQLEGITRSPFVAQMSIEDKGTQDLINGLNAGLSAILNQTGPIILRADNQASEVIAQLYTNIDETLLTPEFITYLDANADGFLSVMELAQLHIFGFEQIHTAYLQGNDGVTPVAEQATAALEQISRSPFVAQIDVQDAGTQETIRGITAGLTAITGLTSPGLRILADDQASPVIAQIYTNIDETLLTPEFITYLDANADGLLSEAEIAQIAIFGFDKVYTAFLDANPDAAVAGAKAATDAVSSYGDGRYDAGLTVDDEQAVQRAEDMKARIAEIDAEQATININDPYTPEAIARTKELQAEREALTNQLVVLGVEVNNEQALTEYEEVTARGDELRRRAEELGILIAADPRNQELIDELNWVNEQITIVDGREAVLRASIDAAPFDATLTLITDDLNETFGPRYKAFLDADGDGVLSETERAQDGLEGIAKRWTAFLELYSGDTDVQLDFIAQRLNDIGRPIGINVFMDASAALAVIHGVNTTIRQDLLDQNLILYLDADNNGVLTAVEIAQAAAGQWSEEEYLAWLGVEGNAEKDLAETKANAEDFDNAEYQATLTVDDQASPKIHEINRTELEDKEATTTVRTDFETAGEPTGTAQNTQSTHTIDVADEQARADVAAFVDYADQAFSTHQLLVLGVEDDVAIETLATFQAALQAYSDIPVAPRTIAVDTAQAITDLQTFQTVLDAFTIIPVPPRVINVDTAPATLSLQTLQTTLDSYLITPPAPIPITADTTAATTAMNDFSLLVLGKVEEIGTFGLATGAAWSEQFAAGVAPATESFATTIDVIQVQAVLASLGMYNSGQVIGNEFTQGVIDSLSRGTSIVYNYAYRMAEAVYFATLAALTISSPSKRAEEAIGYWNEGVINTLAAGEDPAAEAARNAALAIDNAFTNALGSGAGQDALSLYSQIDAGTIAGMKGRSRDAINVAHQFIDTRASDLEARAMTKVYNFTLDNDFTLSAPNTDAKAAANELFALANEVMELEISRAVLQEDLR